MKVLILGNDGRTHAFVWKLFNSSHVTQMVCTPGNGGTGQLVPHVELNMNNMAQVAHWAFQEGIDMIIPSSQEYLECGLADEAAIFHIDVFGPTRQVAELARSRCRTKEFLLQHGIPTAEGKSFRHLATAEKYLATKPLPVVIKSDHRAVGVGIYQDRYMAMKALREMFESRPVEGENEGVVIEHFIRGTHISISAFTDGETVIPLLPTRIYNHLQENNSGPVAPGMGAHTSTSTFAQKLTIYLQKHMFQPLILALKRENMLFRGILGIDCLITDHGPKITALRYAMRDQETQVVFPRLEDDLMALIQATMTKRLHQYATIQWRDHASVGITLVAEGYPHHFPTGSPIEGITDMDEGVLIFHDQTYNPLSLRYETFASRGLDPLSALMMGGSGRNAPLTTCGGHVLTLVAMAASLNGARGRAILNAERVRFAGRYYRGDIGQRDFTP